MSNEMNLYKRCKNIFKSHGADMGGGGCTILGEITAGEEGLIGPEANASDLIERLERGEVIAILVELSELPGATMRVDGNIWSSTEDAVMFPLSGANGMIILRGSEWVSAG